MENDTVNFSDVNNSLNHASRRKIIKRTLKNQKIEVKDHNGKIHVKDKLDEIKQKESNYNNWAQRVQRAQEMGKKIELLNKEERYNLDLKINEERDKQRLINFIEIYGEEVGKKMFNDDNINRRERESKKRKRKLEKKMNKKK